jgi:phosphomannomutase
MSDENSNMSDLVNKMVSNYPCSGEINSTVSNAQKKIEEIQEKYSDGKVDELDGLSIEYPNWRFNVRMSNTEPLLRLNVESRHDEKLMASKTAELLELIRR